MGKTARKRDYIFQRPGSANWYIKLRSPGEKRKEISLGTTDRMQAEILSLPLIEAHKKALQANRPRMEKTWAHQLLPGLHEAPELIEAGYTLAEGGRIFATDRELHYLDASGATVRTEPNGMPALRLVGRGPEAARLLNDFAGGRLDRPKVPTKIADDAIIETYIKQANLTGYPEKETRAVWALFRSLCDKPLKDCSRDDGRLLVAHYEALTPRPKAASIRKKIMRVNAAVNLAIKERRDDDPLKLKFNPFTSIVPNPKPGEPGASEKRFPLDDDDIAAAKRNLGELDKNNRMLFRVLATTGMRLSEAFQIDGEKTERGVRYVIVGHKTDQSERRVPLPADLLPHLPKTIKGKLFTGETNKASKDLNHFLRDCGIADKRKVLHSLRHRAQDRLRAFECPQDIRWALLGHEEKSVAEGYGKGFAVLQLKKWIDRIGF